MPLITLILERRYTVAVNRLVHPALMLVFLVACGSQVVGTSPAPRPTRTQPSTGEPISTQIVRSPDGTPRAEQVCYQDPSGVDCSTVFPNGDTLYGAPGQWSRDGQYALNCFASIWEKPCDYFSVWDMVNGRVVTTHILAVESNLVAWSPEQPHTLLYIFSYRIDNIPDDLFALDAATGSETVLQQCPAWVDSQLGRSCGAAPGLVVSGKVMGLPSRYEAVIRTYDLSQGRELRGYQVVETDGGIWQQLLRQSFGPDFEITVSLQGYVGGPTSYDLHVDGTQVFRSNAGRLDPILPDALDFALAVR